MADWLKPFAPAIRGRAVVRTPPVLARYLDDLRIAEQARALDRHFGRLPAEGGMFDNIDVPEIPDPIAPDRAVGAAPRSWLEGAEMSRAMEPQPAPPLTDMLLDNDRRRALIGSRLDRLTPEQQARSLPVVGRQYEADQAAARAADIRYGRDVNTAAALAAAGIVGGGAMYGRMSQLAEEAARGQAENDFDLGPDLSGSPDGAMPMTMDLEEDALMDSVASMPAPMAEGVDEDALLGSVQQQLAGVPQFAGGQPPPRSGMDLFADDPMMNLEPDSPDEAIASAPGPSIPVGRNMDMETLPGPQMRSVRALIRAGIPAGRAMDIITKGYSMSPDEYRMVTGGRR